MVSEDDPEQEVVFHIEGPDDKGCVWACSTIGSEDWCQNLGPTAKVVEVMSRWLASIDADERNVG
jgi:hypothetical protein